MAEIKTSPPENPVPAIAFVIAVVFCAAMWFYVDRIIIPIQVANAARYDTPRGNFSDLYPRWLGARELLLHHRDPYQSDVTAEIQEGYYGRRLDPNRPHDPSDQAAFAYPVYVAFLLAPFVRMPFAAIRFPLTLGLASLLAWSALLWFRMLKVRSLAWQGAGVALLLGSLAGVQAIKLQQLTLLVAFLLAGAVCCLMRGRAIAGGTLLALATIKPQLTLLPALFLLVWALGSGPRQWKFAASFAGVTAMLAIAGLFLLPAWPLEFWQALHAYRQYTQGSSGLGAIFGETAGIFAAAFCVAVAVRAGVDLFVHRPVEENLVPLFALTLLLTLLVVPGVSMYNQVMLVPAVVIIFAGPRPTSSVARVLAGLTAITIAWQWVAAIALDSVHLLSPAAPLGETWKLPFATALSTPAIAFAALIYRFKEQAPARPRRFLFG